MKGSGRLALMLLTGLLAVAAPRICSAQGGHGGGGGGHGFGGLGAHGGGNSGHALAGNGSAHAPGHPGGHSIIHFFGRGQKGTPSQAMGANLVAPTKVTPANTGLLFPQGFLSRPRGPGTAFVVVGPFQVHHHRKHSGLGGCPNYAFPRSLFWRGDFDCFSDGFDPPMVGGSSRYDFPVTGRGFVGRTVPSGDVAVGGGTEDFAAKTSSDRLRTLLALEDGSEFGLTEYWLEGHELHYVTSYGGRNSLPVERIDLDRTVKDNAERGVEFVLRPRPARIPPKAITP